MGFVLRPPIYDMVGPYVATKRLSAIYNAISNVRKSAHIRQEAVTYGVPRRTDRPYCPSYCSFSCYLPFKLYIWSAWKSWERSLRLYLSESLCSSPKPRDTLLELECTINCSITAVSESIHDISILAGCARWLCTQAVYRHNSIPSDNLNSNTPAWIHSFKLSLHKSSPKSLMRGRLVHTEELAFWWRRSMSYLYYFWSWMNKQMNKHYSSRNVINNPNCNQEM